MDKAGIVTQVTANKKAVEAQQKEAEKIGKNVHVTMFALALQEATAKLVVSQD
jgi:hypothetical protein